MVIIGDDLMTWDEETKQAVFFYQGDICLEVTVKDFDQAAKIVKCIENIYKFGVKDAITASLSAIDAIITD